jgi:hypothetical protein
MNLGAHATPISWSAATCDFKGAGVYVGLAPEYEHIAVARAVAPKQMHVYLGGRMRSPGEARPWPIHYYAIRDPSVLRVIPVHQPALPNGFRPVHLRFRFPENNGTKTVFLSPPNHHDAGSDPLYTSQYTAAPAGFLISVGMQFEREQEFFAKTLQNHLDQDWEEVFQRIAEYGCRGSAA